MSGIKDIFDSLLGREKIRPKKVDPSISKKYIHEEPSSTIEGIEHNPYLGLAGDARNKVKEAIKSKKYSAAWRFCQEEKTNYMKFVNKSNSRGVKIFEAEEAIEFDASVSEQLANILRLEGKHRDAFSHIVYWNIGTRRQYRKKRQMQKLSAYFNRCKFVNTEFDEARDFIDSQSELVQFPMAKNKVKEWISREDK